MRPTAVKQFACRGHRLSAAPTSASQAIHGAAEPRPRPHGSKAESLNSAADGGSGGPKLADCHEVRATDGAGRMQPAVTAWKPKGYPGNSTHRIVVSVA